MNYDALLAHVIDEHCYGRVSIDKRQQAGLGNLTTHIDYDKDGNLVLTSRTHGYNEFPKVDPRGGKRKTDI